MTIRTTKAAKTTIKIIIKHYKDLFCATMYIHNETLSNIQWLFVV